MLAKVPEVFCWAVIAIGVSRRRRIVPTVNRSRIVISALRNGQR
jgi:hypothetical protein